MKKNLILILLALAALVNLASCGSSSADPSETVSTREEQTEASSESTVTDGSDVTEDAVTDSSDVTEDAVTDSSDGHTHSFTFTGEKDHNYHQVACSCGETKTDPHTYAEFKCPVCESQNYFQYTTQPGAGTCSIYGLSECYSVIVVPAVIDGCRVTSIGPNAFSEKVNRYDGITKVILPDSLTKIGDYAFNYCDDLTEVVIPATLTEIGKYAFNRCENLTEIALGNSLTSLGERAFSRCDSLTEINLPATLTSLGDGNFSECEALSAVTFGGTKAAWEALDESNILTFFDSNVNLVTCADSVYNVNFEYEVNADGETCTVTGIYAGRTELIVPAYLDGYRVTHIGKSDSDVSLYNYRTVPFCKIVLPEGVVAIGENAFYGFSSLTEITLPSTLTAIGESAFGGCALTTVTIPEGVTVLEYAVFTRCKKLTAITLPASLTAIEDNVFLNCGLDEIIYRGTKEQWSAMNFSGDRCGRDATVHCADGDV